MTGPRPAPGDTPRPGPAPDEAGPAAGAPWLRLDRRMLLVYPVQEIAKFLPAVLGAAFLGVSSGNPLWAALGVAAVVPYALTIWFTTTYRIGSTHVELRTGLVRRRRLSVPRARIRSVDIEADPLHRILGLATVVIGTGQEAGSEERFALDGLAVDRVRPLRDQLLAHARESRPAEEPAAFTASGPATEVPPNGKGIEIGHWRPSWVRYAPLSLTGFAFAASAIGVATQFGFGAMDIDIDPDTVDDVRGVGLPVLLLLGLFALCAVVLVVSTAACGHYLITYHGLRVTDYGSVLRIRRGLFTLRQITLDTARLRGATIEEPLLLRLAGAAQLEAVMTGENPRQKILPQAPRPAVERTLTQLLRPHDTEHPPAPGDTAHLAALSRIPLVRHGPAARRRRYFRAGWPVPLSAAVLLVAATTGDLPPWWWLIPVALIPVCGLLAEDRYRSLGHAVVPATSDSPVWLIVRSGSLDRERTCLEAPGIIGWTVRRTFWQRRAGLATVGAATAAGEKLYLVQDIPLDQARALIEAVTPGLSGIHRPAG
ncbi:PH domain-containing protein [Nocardia sp. X0981]